MDSILNSPPIVYMTIETEGKTQDELILEMSKKVSNEISQQLNEIRSTGIDKAELNRIIHTMNIEKAKIIKCFTAQIKNMFRAEADENKAVLIEV